MSSSAEPCTSIGVAWIPGKSVYRFKQAWQIQTEPLLVTPSDLQSRLNILAKQLSLGIEM